MSIVPTFWAVEQSYHFQRLWGPSSNFYELSSAFSSFLSSPGPSNWATIHRKRQKMRFCVARIYRLTRRVELETSNSESTSRKVSRTKLQNRNFVITLRSFFISIFVVFFLYKLENYAPSFKVVVWTRGHRRSIDETLANKVTDIDFRFMTIPPF